MVLVVLMVPAVLMVLVVLMVQVVLMVAVVLVVPAVNSTQVKIWHASILHDARFSLSMHYVYTMSKIMQVA